MSSALLALVAFSPIWLAIPIRVYLRDRAPRLRAALFASLNGLPILIGLGHLLLSGLAGWLLMIVIGWIYLPLSVGIMALNLVFSGIILLQKLDPSSGAQ